MSIATGGSSVTRSSSVHADMVFNVAHESEIIALLRRIHLSILTIDEKNHLRDLIFATRFSNAVVDAAMIQTFASYGFAILSDAAAATLPVREPTDQPTVHVEKPVAPAKPALGFSRQAPQFQVRVMPVLSAAAPIASPSAKEAEVPKVVTSVSVDAPVVPPPTIEEELPYIPVPESIPEVVLEPVQSPSEPMVVPTLVPTPSEPVETLVTQPAQAPMTVSPSPTTQTSAAAAAERIAAIKRDVNAAVGNPVNLIDVNNTVGREYMNALLDAMKKATGAASGQEIERAMARLERAYEAVRGIVTISSTAASLPVVNAAEISAGASQLPSSALPPKETDVPTQPPVAPHNPPMEEVIEIRPKHMADGAAEVVSTPEPMPVQASESLPIEELVPEVVVPKRRQLSVQSADEVLEGGETPLSVPVQSGVQRTPVIEEVQQVPSAPEVVPVIAAIEVEAPRVPEEPVRQARSEELPTEQDASPRADRITSVAKEQQLAELMEARKAAELATDEAKSMRAAQDPLMADEVTQGLHQLLSEWKLFKSSGIFGTGPSGFDHPLYKKLSELTMASLLAGRFEGATAEIKRSISDYMNGWRYEEGVLHEPGETFEMYLRRVIRRILDNQVKK